MGHNQQEFMVYLKCIRKGLPPTPEFSIRGGSRRISPPVWNKFAALFWQLNYWDHANKTRNITNFAIYFWTFIFYFKTYWKPCNPPPVRPIVSSIDTYNYDLAKYHYCLLQPLIPHEYSVADTFTFVNEVKRLSFHNKFMTSFDIVSLFTNIPLEDSIDLAVTYILEGNNL